MEAAISACPFPLILLIQYDTHFAGYTEVDLFSSLQQLVLIRLENLFLSLSKSHSFHLEESKQLYYQTWTE